VLFVVEKRFPPLPFLSALSLALFYVCPHGENVFSCCLNPFHPFVLFVVEKVLAVALRQSILTCHPLRYI
jgi:hypothetical protein